MKKLILGLTFASFLIQPSFASDGCPEFANTVNLKTGKDLEQANATHKAKKKGIYGGVNNSVRLEGGASAVKINAKDAVFAFKPLNPQVQPKQQIKLYQFDDNKTFRELSTGGTNLFGGSKNSKAQDTSIPIILEKAEDGCYIVKVDGTLPAGEYAFSVGANPDVQGTGTGLTGQVWFAFGVK